MSKIKIITPQFEREDGMAPRKPQKSIEWFMSLKKKSRAQLKELGMRPWNEDGLWLFPGEWYNSIPDGIEVVDISYKRKKFKNGFSDDDIRFGCLPYGFVIKNI